MLYLESTRGLEIADCASEGCFAAGEAAPLERQYCDLDVFPHGCVRRWLDARGGSSAGANVPSVGRADADKPGVVPDCLGGEPCVRVGPGAVQARTLEVIGSRPLGPIAGPFSLFMLVRPQTQDQDFFYVGHGGSELVHRSARDSIELRLGVARPVEVVEAGGAPTGRWRLIEVHRDARSAVQGLVDGWDRTPGRPVMTGELSLRHVFSIGRSRAMAGDVAAFALLDRRLGAAEAQRVRRHLGELYGLDFGDGSPPPKNPGRVELARRLWLDWSFDAVRDCRAGSRGGLLAVLGPRCPRNAPTPVPGLPGIAGGGALRFDGVDDEVRSRGALGPMDQLYSFTAAGWVRSARTGRWQTVLDKRDALDDGWDLYLDPAGRGFLRVDGETLEGERVIADGEWHHLAGVFDGERLRLYVDGVFDRGRYLGRRAPITTRREVSAGRNFAGRRDAFEGDLDELRVYGRALDPQEIAALAGRR